MNLPERALAQQMLEQAARLQPGGWVAHSQHAAQAAEAIAVQVASQHPGRLDPESAYVMTLLHDIGRARGSKDMRHVIDGYRFLLAQGCPDAARICLTHSFPLQNIAAMGGTWDGTPEDLRFLDDYLQQVQYNDYDRLAQLCDALALPQGCVLIEKRMVEVALRRGINDDTLAKWRAFLDVQRYFEALMGCSVYQVLPGVVNTTFGFAF